MVEARDPERPRPEPCPACGALNGASFDRCIRCGADLGAAARVARRVRAPEGGDLVGTKILLAFTSLVFLGQVVAAMRSGHGLPIFGIDDFVGLLRYGALPVSERVVAAEPWRLLSAVFVHFGALHFGMNMLSLANLARIAEPAVGFARFVVTYVVTGIVGFAVTLGGSIAMAALEGHAARVDLTAGASGAIFGIIGLVLGLLVRRRDPRWKAFLGNIAASTLMLILIAAQVRAGINNWAHAGGFVAGFVFGLVFAGGQERRRAAWGPPPSRVADRLLLAAAVVGLLACAASLALCQLSPLWRSVAADL
jgi:membrane associated rhomboid family serine protease